MNRTIRFTAAAAVLAIGLGVTACATPAASDSTEGEPVTITFSSYNYGTQGGAGDGTQALLDRFAELHPEITVEPEAVPTVDVLTKTKTAVAAGMAPDVVQMGYSKLAEGLQTLPVQSLQEIAGDEWDEHVDGITPALVEAGEWEGSVHALPYTVSIPTIFYNADLFVEAGLDPQAPLEAIEQVRTAAEAITALGHHGVYFGIVDPSRSDYLTQSVINSAGGSIVDEDGEVAFDSAESVAGLQAIQDLTTDGLQPAVGTEDALAAFASGDLGMLVASTAVLGSIKAATDGVFELRTAAFPSFGAPAEPTFSGAGLVVLSEDDAKQKAAWEFVKFLTSEEGNTIITEQIGYLPLRPDLATDPEYLAGYFEENTLLVPPLEQLPTVRPYLAFPSAKSNQATVLLQDDAVEPIVMRGADPQATLTEVADRIRELVGS